MSEPMRTYQINNQRVATAVFYKQLQDLNDSVANDTKFGKNARTGYFCLAKYDNTGQDEFFGKNIKQLLADHVWNDPWHNWYIAPNTFRANWTRSETAKDKGRKPFNNIRTLTSFYVDFDVEKSHLDMARFENDMMQKILPACNLNPTAVIRTGHGYHVYFMLNKGIASNSDLMNFVWREIEKYIFDKINHECKKLYGIDVADHKVVDIPRVLRVPTSYNMKRFPYPMVKIVYLNILNRIDFGKLKKKSYHAYMNHMALVHPYCRDYELIKLNRQNEAKSSRGGNNKGNAELTVSSLQSKRCKDIFQLAQMRSRHHSTTLDREESMFLYACSAVVNYKSNDKIAKKLSELNHTFWKPCADNEVNHVINELPKIRHKVAMFGDGDTSTNHYVYTNLKYINELEITPSEQRTMLTLINTSEKKRRYRKRLEHRKILRLPKLAHTDERRISRDIKMNEQHRNGMTYDEIVNHNNKINSTKTVQRAIKALNILVKAAKMLGLIINPCVVDMKCSLSRISAAHGRAVIVKAVTDTYISLLDITYLYSLDSVNLLSYFSYIPGDERIIGLHGG